MVNVVNDELSGGARRPTPGRAEPGDRDLMARDLWARGYSLRYIAGRLGVSGRAALRMVGPRAIARRAPGGAR